MGQPFTDQHGITREAASENDLYLPEALGYIPLPREQLVALIHRAGELIGCDSEHRNIACIEVALDRLEKLESLNKTLVGRASVKSELLSKEVS